jgi:hypothetical protein
VPASEISATLLPAKRLHQLRSGPLGIVFMVGVRPRGDAETVEQHPADAGILAGNEVGASKRLQPADGHVAEIADWRRDQIEPGLERPCSDLVRADAKRPWRLAAFRCSFTADVSRSW